jgi:UDP-N-acetylmuramoylalanine--D-glutamate ligase
MLKLADLKKKRVLVAGFSVRSGVGAVKLLGRIGAVVSLWDEKAEKELTAPLKLIGDMKIAHGFFGKRSKDFGKILKEAEWIVVSPGVPLNHPLFKEAQKTGVNVISEVELAWMANPSKWICVTGTDGKTTTTTLLGEIFRIAGKDVIVAGNIGRSLCDAVVEKGQSEYVIAELSSFQLESIRTLKPKVSLILNITPDHLDRYASMAEYANAKFRIVMNQGKGDAFVYRKEDKRLARFVASRRWLFSKIPFSRTQKLKEGAFVSDGYFCFAKAGKREKVFPVGKTRLIGEHNKENVLAALAAARFCGIRANLIAKTLENFKGVPHRTEPCGEYEGRRFINDSKATTLNAVRMALLSQEKRCILMMGGQGKGDDFRRIEGIVRRKVKTLVLFGEAAKEISRRVRFPRKIHAGKLADGLRKAFAASSPGDVILLSPGCTSYDEFNNFEERGDYFKRLVSQPEMFR